jgi:hypothetical protein
MPGPQPVTVQLLAHVPRDATSVPAAFASHELP